ncbi:MAG TPA: (d)CMP kinase, partial [Candidatus Omnitrophota bacterium]|nr:(d)CMP kinase [Candidatus Omnitrophota bacterium]
IVGLSKDLDITLMPSQSSDMSIQVFLDGEDVSKVIRTLEVSGNVKHVASVPDVRANLVTLQRKLVSGMNGAVMEGRDIGTVVLPNAKYKIYLDAEFDERVERRRKELVLKGTPATREEVAEDLKQRDHADKTRKVGPLKKADDAVLLDTTGLSIEQVVDRIVGIVRGSERK